MPRRAGDSAVFQRHLDPHRWRDGRAVIAVAILPHEKFSAAVVEEESKPDWYLRQMLGTANFNAGPLLAFSSGNLCYQIEHHLFPDLPSNRYAEIPTRVRALCDKFDLPYTTGSLLGQYMQTVRTINKLALPDRFLTAAS